MKSVTCYPHITVEAALMQLSKSGGKCLVIINKSDLLLGTLSDGDLRKGILGGSKLDDQINGLYKKNPIVFLEREYELSQIDAAFIEGRLDLIPIVDKKGKLVTVHYWDVFYGQKKSRVKKSVDVPVVIMAGGKGTRLEPFTHILPKPLVPIHEKPVIEHIIDRFVDNGVKEIVLSVNYKARLMKAYFEELQPDYSISFIEEPEPQGTAGSLGKLKNRFQTPFFVTNCDVIINLDLADLYQYHMDNGYEVTIVASLKKFTIPYGACDVAASGELISIREKPCYEFLANVGLYVLSPDVLHRISQSEYLDMTTFLCRLKSADCRIGVYPIHDDSWFDTGQWTEYQHAVQQLQL
jgi:dTDP-glucose pyrophosphorylase